MKRILLNTCFLSQLWGGFSSAEQLLPFQGHLTDASGTAVADGSKLVQFKIYDAPVSGTAVWAGEVHKLSVNGGLVNTILGTKTAFPETYSGGIKVMFSEPLYLEITVDADGSETITAADPPLLPRQVLLPANFAHVAMSAETVEGVDLVTDGKLAMSAIADGGIPATKIMDGSILARQMGENSVGAEQIQENAVSGEMVLDSSIDRQDLSALIQKQLDTLNPPGTIIAYAGDIGADTGVLLEPVPGYLFCNGAVITDDLENGKYAALLNALGSKWGDGQDTDVPQTVNLPDLRGVFLRGWSAGASDSFVDEGRDSQRYSRFSGGATGNLVGSFQQDAFESHGHSISGQTSKLYPVAIAGAFSQPGTYTPMQQQYHGSGAAQFSYGPNVISANSVGGSETRPKNANVGYLIKY
ncbi:phage tail protein [Roseibacillus ishigakijimensis]|uniref:Tail fiber protein n=1 Tax=Roseibacillus ishigakijimensis TaxID=454146 RepID=A0A934VNH7_9BACT|nr:phage tail protein [Roseibacillus ishigakijimensis]MBK1835055.1 tail fiber protein [Roseibacillus ishigakijimensis]